MRDLETYISEGFYKTVGAVLTQIKDSFEYLKRGQRVTLVLKKLSNPHSDNVSWNDEWIVVSPDFNEEFKKCQYKGDNVIDSIARAENFLKKDELDKIKIEFSL